MNAHLVWAKTVGNDGPGGNGEIVALYLGEDAVKAEEIYHEHHLDGAYEYVKWAVELRHFRHTTPAKDGCDVRVFQVQPSDEDLQIEELTADLVLLKSELEAERQEVVTLKAEIERISRAVPLTPLTVAPEPVQEVAVTDEVQESDAAAEVLAEPETPKKAKGSKKANK